MTTTLVSATTVPCARVHCAAPRALTAGTYKMSTPISPTVNPQCGGLPDALVDSRPCLDHIFIRSPVPSHAPLTKQHRVPFIISSHYIPGPTRTTSGPKFIPVRCRRVTTSASRIHSHNSPVSGIPESVGFEVKCKGVWTLRWSWI